MTSGDPLTGAPTLEFIGNDGAAALLWLRRADRPQLPAPWPARVPGVGADVAVPHRAVAVTSLPDLDAIVLSHLHGDHWDRIARRGLPGTS
jgi:L-ascorbate metabolism protein UlaG (beta-lactamase superfamily)